MRYSALAFLIGISITQYWPHLPTSVLLNCILIIGVVLLVVAKCWRLSMVACFAWALLGWAWLFISITPVFTWQLPTEWIGQTCLAHGEIVSEPIIIGQRQKFILAIDRLQCGNQQTDFTKAKRILLSWYSTPKKARVTRTSYWQLKIRIKPGWGNVNPGGFDTEKWLLTQRVRYVGYVVNSTENQQHRAASQAVIIQKISQWRMRIQAYLEGILSDFPSRNLLLAMLVGKRTQLSPKTWAILQATGTSHLMAISGLHVGMVATLVGFIVLRVWRCNGRMCLLIPAPLVGYTAALIAAVFYSGLAGFALPTQRALIMFAVFVIALLYRRRFPLLYGFNLALWCILLHDPLVTFTIGFWLSFAAIAAIVYGVSGYQHPIRIWRLTRAQWVISLLLAPLTLWFFSQVSLIGLFANAVAIPWIGFVVLPMGFCGLILSNLLPALGQACLHLSATLLTYLWHYLTWLSHITVQLRWDQMR